MSYLLIDRVGSIMNSGDHCDMTTLFGSKHRRSYLAERTGALAQLGGVRLAVLDNGAARGVRVLDFNTGSGLRFTVNVDRAMDIGEMSHNGRAIGWQSAMGTRNPSLNGHEEDDEQF